MSFFKQFILVSFEREAVLVNHFYNIEGKITKC